ncbi:MAG: hypothetical protein AB7G75_25605 [Candidatus Binatia bacterium]
MKQLIPFGEVLEAIDQLSLNEQAMLLAGHRTTPHRRAGTQVPSRRNSRSASTQKIHEDETRASSLRLRLWR